MLVSKAKSKVIGSDETSEVVNAEKSSDTDKLVEQPAKKKAVKKSAVKAKAASKSTDKRVMVNKADKTEKAVKSTKATEPAKAVKPIKPAKADKSTRATEPAKADKSEKVVKPPSKVQKTVRLKDMYKLNLSHSGVIKTCISVRKDKKNWVTEHGSDYSLTVFNSRILRTFLTEIMLAKGYRVTKARLFVDILVRDLKMTTHESLITILRGYIDDLAFRNRLNFFIDRDVNTTREMILNYMLEVKYKSTVLDAMYSKQEYMQLILNYLLPTLYKIRKFALKEGKKTNVTRGITGVIKDLSAKEYNGSVYFFLTYDNSKPTLKACKKIEAAKKTGATDIVAKEYGVYYSADNTLNAYETLFNLFVIKKMNKELYERILDRAMIKVQSYINNDCTPFDCLQIEVDNTMDNCNSCKLDNDLAIYKVPMEDVLKLPKRG